MHSREAKRKALIKARAWNPSAQTVKADIFHGHVFFDAEDKAQVKYEMLRRREVDAAPAEVTCQQFGFTRESYRQALARFRSEGMAGLFERKRGRRGPVKITEEVRNFLRAERQQRPELTPDQLAQRCHEETGASISRRSVYRALGVASAGKKKRRRPRTRRRGW